MDITLHLAAHFHHQKKLLLLKLVSAGTYIDFSYINMIYTKFLKQSLVLNFPSDTESLNKETKVGLIIILN